ncbi:MAG: ptrB [Acidimicrobiaceae bacterium]|jgi:oligopeptidase B|nr:ptrB [Acidimicrobiaceae bacterium]
MASEPSTDVVPPPPLAPRRPHALEAHGDVRSDDWWWLRDREDPEVIAYLEAENAYADAWFAPLAGLQLQLFEQIKGRVQEDDVSAPSRRGDWWYWSSTAEGAQYRTYHRLEDPERRHDAARALEIARAGGGEVILDENALAGGHDYFALGVFDVSIDHALLAYAVDLDGSERYALRFRDLGSGEDLPDLIEGVHYGSAWAADHRTFFYVRPDAAMRPYQVWTHRLGEPVEDDRLVYEESDERFSASVGLTRSERYVLVQAQSKMTSEARWIDAAAPESVPAVVLARRQGVEYDVDHAVLPGEGDVWLVRSNAPGADGDEATNFSVTVVPLGSSEATETLVGYRSEVKIEAIDAFSSHVVVVERESGLERLRVIWLADRTQHVVEQPDPVYSLTGTGNAEWEGTTYRFGYTSLVTPVSTIDYDVATRERRVVKVQPVLGGYRPEEFRSERIWATAPDGTKVPISLVCRRDQILDGSAPCLLYGYGSYEITIDPTFSAARLNLLERGMVFAIAHVRGGGEMGRRWYEEGRLEQKSNTFTDFIACAEHLVAEGYTSPDRLVIRGGSAGGLLVGAAMNLRPELFAAVVAEVPFVDVVTTMSDDTLPLTVGEWEEWGDPITDADAYRRMLAYSPYDNVRRADYPAMYVTAGLNDPRVGFWEPAKWVAKLRAATTGSRPILLRTELGAGHQGPSGRYEAWRDEARVQSFVLTWVGIAD